MNFLFSPCALAAVPSAELAGAITGLILGGVMIFAGMGKCISLIRRPTTSTLCVLPLLLLLLCWLLGMGWNMVLNLGWVDAALSWLILLVTGPLFISILVLSIVGLALYDSTRFNQGRKQAVWAMVLAAVGLTGALTVHLAEPLKSLAEKVVAEARAGQPGQAAIKEEWNFSLTPPDKTWIPKAPDAWSPLGAASFLKADQNLYAMVVAEKNLSLMDGGLETMTQSVKTHLKTTFEVRSQSEQTVSRDGLVFMRLTTQAWSPTLKTEVYSDRWLTTHLGYAWQIVIWGTPDQKLGISAASEELIRGFQVLDKARKVPADATVDTDRRDLGFKTERLGEMGWQTCDMEASNMPELTSLAVETYHSAFIIRACPPVLKGGPLPLEAVARACLAELDFGYERNNPSFVTREVGEPLPGIEIITEREVEGGEIYRYVFRVHQKGVHAWMLGGWTKKTPESSLDRLRESIGRVTLQVPAGPAVKKTLSSKQIQAQATWVNQVGLWYHDAGKYAEAEKHFRSASAMMPERQDFFGNVAQVLETQDKAEEALAWMQEAAGREFATDPNFRLRRAELLLVTGKAEEGSRLIDVLIREGCRNHDKVLSCINKLLEGEHHKQAREVSKVYAEVSREPRARLWQAQVADQTEAPGQAASLAEALVKEEPDYLEGIYWLGEFSNRQGNHERALELAGLLEKDGQRTARLLLMEGWAHLGKKRYRDAKESFEKAAVISPNDEDVKSALKEVAAYLGQGSNAEIKTVITPVPLPPHVAEQMQDLLTLPAEYGEGYHTTLLLYSLNMDYSPSRPMRTTLRRLIRILNEEGAEAYSSMQHTYDPMIERLHVNRAEVLDEAGKVVARAGLDDVYVLDSGDRSMATTDRTVHIQIPGLKPGFTVDCEITVERHTPRLRFPIMRHAFAASIPTRLEVLSLTGDLATVSEDLVNAGDLKVKREKDSLVYEMRDAPVTVNEPYQQPMESWVPVLVLAGKDKSWEEIGKQYLADISRQLEPDAEIEAEARQLTEGQKTLREKVRTLAAHVQKSVSYKAIEFGVRGQIPNPPSQTLQQRYGDCKDQALLLHHLLRACDIPSSLALINTRWELELNQPTLDAFNHAIVHVPGLGGSQFIDTTASYLAVAEHSPYNLWGMPVLVLNPDKPVIMRIPEPVAGSGDVNSKRHLSLEGEEGLRITEELTLHGYYASGMRSGFARTEPKERFQYAQDLLNDRGNYRLEEFEFVHLTDVTRPAVLRMTYILPNALEKRGETVKLKLPSAWESDYLQISYIKERQSAFRWLLPFRMKSEVTWDGSLKMALDSFKGLNRSSKGEFGQWEMKAGGEGLSFEFAVKRGDYPAGDYAAFQSLWSGARDLWARELTVDGPSE